jgi:Ca2+-binding EF-hand superfamily protein
MTSLGFESKNGAIFQMIADLDADGNGNIDFGEWLGLMTKRVNDKDSRANINKIFALFDDERTGFISIKNLRRVAQELGENISEEELQELINRADIDHDGLVSEEEFYVIVTRKIKD